MSEPEAKLTPYEQRCRETCQWCLKGIYRHPGHRTKVAGRIETGPSFHEVRTDEGLDVIEPCTAPTIEQFAEEMAQEAEAARNNLTDLVQGYPTFPDIQKEWEDAYREAMKRGDQWREKFDSEHETRIKYQDIAYMVCNFLDVALGNSAKRSTCLVAEKDAIHLALVRLFHSQHQPEEPNSKR